MCEYPKTTTTGFGPPPLSPRPRTSLGVAAARGSRSNDSRVIGGGAPSEEESFASSASPRLKPQRLRPHVTTSPLASTAAVAYRPAATATAAVPNSDRSTARATPSRHAAPPTHASPSSYASRVRASPPICAPPSPSPPHAHPPPLSQTHASPSATPYVPARPSCPRSFSPNVSTVPSAASATVWYRPTAHETIFTSSLGMATRPNASPRPPRPSWPASFTGGEPCPPPPAESLRPAVYSAPASVTSAE